MLVIVTIGAFIGTSCWHDDGANLEKHAPEVVEQVGGFGHLLCNAMAKVRSVLAALDTVVAQGQKPALVTTAAASTKCVSRL